MNSVNKNLKEKCFKIAILSSKGGVGKTMLASSLIDLLARDGYKVNALDCDVNAPNLALWLGGVEVWDRVLPIKILPLPNRYKRCQKVQILCDGKLMNIEEEKRGEVRIKENFSVKFGNYKLNLISGSIDENKTGSGKVIEGVLREASRYESQITVIDSAPGTGYPVLAPLRNSDFAVLITEPTILGFSDLKKLVEIVEINKKNYGIVVNKWNINPEIGEKIKKFASERFLGKIDFSPEIEQDLRDRVPPTIHKTKVSEQIRNIYQLIKGRLSII